MQLRLGEAVRDTWGLEIPKFVEFTRAIEWIGKFTNLFLVIDDIGSALGPQKNDGDAWEKFVGFVGQFCMPMSDLDGVYFLLCARAPFLSIVAARNRGINLTSRLDFVQI
jgi:hypothetical protein